MIMPVRYYLKPNFQKELLTQLVSKTGSQRNAGKTIGLSQVEVFHLLNGKRKSILEKPFENLLKYQGKTFNDVEKYILKK